MYGTYTDDPAIIRRVVFFAPIPRMFSESFPHALPGLKRINTDVKKLYIYNMKPKLPDYKYCPWCGKTVGLVRHEGRDRHVCSSCGRAIYVNPIPASTVVVLDGRRLLLTLRAADPKKGWWCLPGGFVEWGETPEEAARRELFEETGLTAETLGFVGVYNSMVTVHALLHGFIVERWSGDPVSGDDAEAVEWFSIDSLPPLAFDAHAALLSDALRRKGLQ